MGLGLKGFAAALGALLVDGLLTSCWPRPAGTGRRWVLWAAISGLNIFFNTNTGSLRQQIVPTMCSAGS